MAFRAGEEAEKGYQSALKYLVPRDASDDVRRKSREMVEDLVDELGPVINAYPVWHPLVSAWNPDHYGIGVPSNECGYKGLDHTVLFAHGFVSCPYDDGQRILDSVENLPENPLARITARRLKTPLYHETANPILVKCEWKKPIHMGKTIPKSMAVPLLLERELPSWRTAQCAETWETMRPYFLGEPHGSRSSLFIDQDTGQVLKSLWNQIINTGMFGNIRVD
jgi:hypothetical protein|tara:strand:+ start:1200 stop:1868 length:669 start_codon:yes stop_codon:yes gene_type:complete